MKNEEKTRSYYAYIQACQGSLLLGGVKEHRSSRFETQQMASDWIYASLQANCQAGRNVAAWGTVASIQPPEVTEEENKA
jgi:hypothetical protein